MSAPRWLSRLVAALLVALATAAPLAPVALAQSQPRTNLADLEDEVMCVVCGRPLATSAGSAADQERQLIQGWIDEGLTKAQIKDRLVAEFGDRALVDDRSPIAAAAPWLAAIAGAASIALLLRRRRQRELPAAAGGAPVEASSNGHGPAARVPAVSAADEARIDAELKALD